MVKQEYGKYITQSSILIIEIIIFVGFLSYLSTFLFPFQNNYDIIERFILFFALYEIFVYCTLKSMNDAQKDALNTVRSYYEKCILYFELLNQNPKRAENYKINLFKTIDVLLDKRIFNTEEVIEYYEKLKENVNTEDLIEIKYDLIRINHCITHLDLNFMFSFLLRILKRPPRDLKEKAKN